MRSAPLIALLVATCILPLPTISAAAGGTAAPTPETLPAVPPVESALKGDAITMPFDGFLVPEATFTRYLHQSILVEELTLKVEARDRLLAAPPPGSFPEPRPLLGKGANGWVFAGGVALGFIIAGAVVWAAVQVLGVSP
jgi:hypothetical protein